MLRHERLAEEEADSTEARTPFQRDRDRILYSAHFRRLGGITQVATPTELYSFHNRLTHTLEVAQIARRIGERLIRDTPTLEIDPDVLESAALAHDLGHPPFGHNGEKQLNKLAKEDGYEGNAQSFRILTKLAARSIQIPGLNLTRATLRASLKYPWSITSSRASDGKYGVFATEESLLGTLFDGEPTKTLEAQIMDWADDVAYSTHDIYDFAIAGLLPLSKLANSTADELKDLLSYRPEVSNLPEDVFNIVRLSLSMINVPLQGTYSTFNSTAVCDLKSWVSSQIATFTLLNLKATPTELQIAVDAKQQVEVLKAITFHYAIGSPALAVKRHSEIKIIEGLYSALQDNSKASKDLFSDEAKRRLDEEGNVNRVICDVISSMTDAQATSVYQKLSGIVSTSILDRTTLSTL